ncbi:MAG: sugar-transfer associated ATP-grasp domain-containing protein [Cypionkella sp.]
MKLGSGDEFLTAKAAHPINPLTTLRHVQAEHGVSAARQLWEIARLGRSRARLPPEDYYSRGLYRRSLSWHEKTCYIGEASNHRLNHDLQSDRLATHWAMINDKMLSAFVLQGMGLPTSNTLAVFGSGPCYGTYPHVKTRDGLIAALANPPEAGLFGKPVDGSLGVGAVSIVGREASGDLRLLDGRQVSPEALADEIMRTFPAGYLVQERLALHPDLAVKVGPAVSTLRICTIHPESGPELFYAVLRLPAVDAPIDGGAISTNAVALIDPATGKVVRAMRGIFPTGAAFEAAPTGVGQLVGMTLPDYAAAVAMAVSAHRGFADHGILGWDVVLTPKGPVINEINANLHHMVWQRASDRGFLNPEHVARLAPVRAFVAAKLAAKKSVSR